MQRDDRLARAGAICDLGDPAGGGADRFVLVALDGRDDVAHAAAAAAGERSHEGPVTDDHEVIGRLRHHEVVLDADDGLAATAQDPSTQDAERLDGGGAIERSCCGGAPVDDERLVIVVADAEAADIPDFAAGGWRRRGVVEVEPTEHEPFELRVEGVLATGSVEHQSVPLEEAGEFLVSGLTRALGAPAREAFDRDQPSAFGGFGQLRIDGIDMGLLGGDLASQLGSSAGGCDGTCHSRRGSCGGCRGHGLAHCRHALAHLPTSVTGI